MKQRPKLLLLLPLLTLTLVAGLLMNPSSVQAASSTALESSPHFFWAQGRAPSSGGPTTSNLIYHGGPVMAGKMKVYAIFWEPSGSSVSRTYNTLLKRYFGDIGNAPLYENNEQYTDTSGQAPTDAELASTFVDTSPYPSTPFLLDSDIQNEVTHAMSVKGWTPKITHMFFVYTALNEYVCMTTSGPCSAPFGFCAYHSAFGTLAAPIIYAAMPYDGNDLSVSGGCYGVSNSPNHDADADAEISTTSHEQIEAATDPIDLSGWNGPGGGSDEIGDKCAYVYGPLNSKNGDVLWNGHPYMVQSEWDNAVSGCVFSGP